MTPMTPPQISSIYYNGLEYHLREASHEIGVHLQYTTDAPDIAIFSKKYYQEIQQLNNDKIYDYCFIGSIKSSPENRQWVVEFAKKYFTENSVFTNTDNDENWVSLGTFDLTKENKGYCPKIQCHNYSYDVQYRKVLENLFYFQTMRQSKFCLCPIGDAIWSFRFYEVLMCGSIPIVESIHHTYRTVQEYKLKYSYYLKDPHTNHVYDENMVKNNDEIFRKNHLFQ